MNPDHATPFHEALNGPQLSAHEYLRARYLLAYAEGLPPEQAPPFALLLHLRMYLDRGWHELARHLLDLYRDT